MRCPMRRRSFLTLLGTSAAAPCVSWPLAARAQQPRKVWRIGFLVAGVRPRQLGSSVYGGFLRGMRELGYAEGRDFVMEWRFAETRSELYFELAAELVQANVDVIVSSVGSAVPAVQRANPRIPIVLGGVTDPVGFGLIASLARPGGNVTALASSDEASTPNHLELLKMIATYVPRIGYATSGAGPPNITRLKAAQDAATQAGRELVPVGISNLEGVPGAFATLANERAGALLVASTPLTLSLRQRIA